MFVCHSCPGDDHRWCVNPRHLWLGTSADNAHDLIAKGRAKGPKANPTVRAELVYKRILPPERGELYPFAKLTEEDVRSIRSRYSFRRVTAKMLAAEYGVHEDTIKLVLQRKTWRHVP
jgi:hypothetical protein